MTNPPFGFDAPEDSTGFLLWQTTISWQRMIKKALEPHYISHAPFVIIAILLWRHGQKKEVTQIDIITMSKLDKMTVSKSLRKLAAFGCVYRIEQEIETRAKSVSLTEKGKEIVRTLLPIVKGIDSTFFGKASHKEQKSLVQILAKLTAGTTDE